MLIFVAGLELSQLGVSTTKARVRMQPMRGLEASQKIKKGEVVATIPRSLTLAADGEARLASLVEQRNYSYLPDSLELPDLKSYPPLGQDRSLPVVRSRCLTGPSNKYPYLFALWLAVGYALLGGTLEQAATGAATALLALLVSELSKTYYFVPGLDLANHKSDYRPITYDFFNDKFDIIADRDYDEGDEIFVSYGRKSNAQLLLNYGFVEDDNPYDDYIFPDDHPLVPSLRVTRESTLGDDARSACRQEADVCRRKAEAYPELAALHQNHAKLLDSLV